MPEKPEVITVCKTLEKRILGKTIINCKVYWDNIIIGKKEEFINKIRDQKIESMTTRGKWLVFFLTKDALLIHLRMEGRFYFRKKSEPRSKHEHVVFTLEDGEEMRFHDVRKFGKMMLLPKQEVFSLKPLNELGYEFDDKNLTEEYLLEKWKKKKLPIKSVLLDQSIIAGIGNIYDDEILFLSHISPFQPANTLTKKDASLIIKNTREVLGKAIQKGGTTIKSFESSEGVHGFFQNELAVHGKNNDVCPLCGSKIEVTKIGGRGTYYCPMCQKEHSFKVK